MAAGFHEDVCCRQHKNKSHTCKPKLGLSMKASPCTRAEENTITHAACFRGRHLPPLNLEA